MSALSEGKIAIVRTLVESAPDRVVGGLWQALAETTDDSALGGVKRLVEVEVSERNLRNTILQPIAPMCIGAGDDPHRLTFPSWVLRMLWRGLCAVDHEELIAKVRNAPALDTPAHLVALAADRLTALAAASLRAREQADFRAVAQLCDEGRTGGADLLAACLDIAPTVRRATQKLPEWLAHSGGDTAAGARLAYRDAVTADEDAGARFFEMLSAQMAYPWMVLRVISAVMDKPTERYLADSEMAGFGEGLLTDIDASLAQISGLDADAGPLAARSVAKLAELVIQQIMEIETSVDLQREHGWGQRVHKQRAGLASVVEGRLREAEKAAMEALPMQAARNPRIRRPAPRLDMPPDPRCVGRARTLLSFSDELRSTANYGGFSSARNKMVEKLSEYIDQYVHEVLDTIRAGEVEDIGIAAAYLEEAAALDELIRGTKAGELVRRRAQAVLQSEPSRQHNG